MRSSSASRAALALAVGALLAGTCPALAGPGAVQAACFSPEALAAQPGENLPVKLGKPMTMRVPASLAAGAPTEPKLKGAIRRIELPRGQKLIALTLDMCEQWSEVAGYDGAIIDYLRANRVKATIFAGGKWMTTHADRTQQLLTDDLFEIGTHGWAHKNVRGLNGAELLREITAPIAAFAAQRRAIASHQCAAGTAAALQSVPERPRLYRFPFGACSAEALDAVQASGMLAIQWDVSTGDPAPTQSAQAIAQQMIANTRPGSIIIAHANGRGVHTAAALPLAIPALKAKGFKFVTVSELLAAGRPVIADTCYDSRPGDTDKYDVFFLPPPMAAGAGVPLAAPQAAAPPASVQLPPLRTTVGR